ncbi:uncharacterized protein METZ01_LOCUS511390 [marine metagenome]|uniref:Uncharacterized protein n=1 Tax=marine metagenome TaxID=408172 RepID=A0A383ENT9_9ZZZZ
MKFILFLRGLATEIKKIFRDKDKDHHDKSK